MKNKILTNKLFDLFFITDLKRVKADEAGYSYTRDELINTLGYIDEVIADELDIEWKD